MRLGQADEDERVLGVDLVGGDEGVDRRLKLFLRLDHDLVVLEEVERFIDGEGGHRDGEEEQERQGQPREDSSHRGSFQLLVGF